MAVGGVEEVGEAVMDGVERAEPVHARHRLDVGQRLVAERAVVGDAGVGDEEVEAAGLRDEALEGVVDRAFVADVAGQHVVGAGQAGGERVELVGRPGRQPEDGAAGGERLGQRRADPARGARDERARARRDLHRGAAYRPSARGYDGGHGRDARDRRRGGVPPDAVLAAGGRPADDRRQRRPGHAALAADGARDDRAPRARRLHRARRVDKTISFTDDGLEHAEGIVRRHRLIERFLTDVLGIPWDEVHEEAERLEHAMSPVLEARMLAAIGDAKTCPHGHPIHVGKRIDGVPLADVDRRRERQGPALRERGRGPPALPQGRRARARPGGHRCRRRGRRGGRRPRAASACAVTRSVAETVSVVADPSPPPRTALPEQLVLAQERYGR